MRITFTKVDFAARICYNESMNKETKNKKTECEEQWNEFTAALDRPAVIKPRLKALLDSEDPFTDNSEKEECERCKRDSYVPHDNCIYGGGHGHSKTHCTASACF